MGRELALVAFELEALARLLHQWTSPTVLKKRQSQWNKKLKYFRKAVMAATGKGQKRWPRELVAFEFEVVLEAVKWVRKQPSYNKAYRGVSDWLARHNVVYHIESSEGLTLDVKRPFPAPPEVAKALDGRGTIDDSVIRWRGDPKVVARQIVGGRLERSGRGTKLAVDKALRTTATMAQKLLMSIFFDLCAVASSANVIRLQGMILDTLLLSGFHVLAVFHMTEQAGEFRNPIAMAAPDGAEIEKLCRAVYPKLDSSERPFSKLLTGDIAF